MTGHIGRREFITLLGGATAAWPLAARAQQGERVRHVGVLLVSGPEPLGPFREALGDLGYPPKKVTMLWRTWSSMTSVIRAQEVRHSRDYFWCTAVPSIVCRNVLRKRRGCPPRHAKDQRDLTKLCRSIASPRWSQLPNV